MEALVNQMLKASNIEDYNVSNNLKPLADHGNQDHNSAKEN